MPGLPTATLVLLLMWMVVDPWGEILDRKLKGPGWVMAELDHARIAEIRSSLPALAHRKL